MVVSVPENHISNNNNNNTSTCHLVTSMSFYLYCFCYGIQRLISFHTVRFVFKINECDINCKLLKQILNKKLCRKGSAKHYGYNYSVPHYMPHQIHTNAQILIHTKRFVIYATHLSCLFNSLALDPWLKLLVSSFSPLYPYATRSPTPPPNLTRALTSSYTTCN